MGKMIKIKELIGSEIRSRIPITTIKSQMVESIPYIIDMEGVTFISRSFADELYNLTQDYNNVHFTQGRKRSKDDGYRLERKKEETYQKHRVCNNEKFYINR